MTEMVNHPAHYNFGKHEVIDLVKHFNFVPGNAIKYILRAPHKGKTAEDFAKALWYVRHWRDNGNYELLEPEVLEEVQNIAQDFGNIDALEFINIVTGQTYQHGGARQEDFILDSIIKSLESKSEAK